MIPQKHIEQREILIPKPETLQECFSCKEEFYSEDEQLVCDGCNLVYDYLIMEKGWSGNV